MRQAASLAIDRPSINQALTLGLSRLNGSIIPTLRVLLAATRPRHTTARRPRSSSPRRGSRRLRRGRVLLRRLLCQSGRGGRQLAPAGRHPDQLRPLERAAFFSGYAEKKFKNLIQGSSGAFGNAATRLEAFVAAGRRLRLRQGTRISTASSRSRPGGQPKRREATLQRIQQLVHDKTVYAPIWELAFLNGVGPRVRESGLGLIAGHAYSAPYEDIALKGK